MKKKKYLQPLTKVMSIAASQEVCTVEIVTSSEPEIYGPPPIEDQPIL